MIKLIDIDENNWTDVKHLCLSNNQQDDLANPMDVMAMAYVYCHCNPRVIGVANDNQIIGISLVKDSNEEPVCCDLDRFIIDKRFQHNGFGTEALRLIVSGIENEGKYNSVKVCVKKSNIPH